MVGDILRREREKQGFSIADVSEETSIKNTYLEAIERGDYDKLPGDVYTKGFIRNYARFLQLDGDSLVEEFASERNITKVVQPVDMPQAEEEKPKYKSAFFGSKLNGSDNHVSTQQTYGVDDAPRMTNLFASGDEYRDTLEREKSSGTRKLMALLAVVVLFLGGVYVAFMDDGSEQPSKPAVNVAKQEDSAPAPVNTVQKEEKAQQPAKAYDGVEVTAKLLERCWLSVEVDGKSVFVGTEEAGKEFSWKGNESINIVAGNAGGIDITFNGKSVGVLGTRGQVEERRFAKGTEAKPLQATAEAAAAPKEN